MLRVGILCCTGCQLVFPVGGELPPPETPLVTGRLVQPQITLGDADTIVRTDLPVSELGVTASFEDGSSVSVAVAADGSFELARPTQHYRLRMVRGLDILELDEEAPELVISFLPRMGRDAPAVGPNTFLSMPTLTTGSSPLLALTGQWSRTSPMMMVDWSTLRTFDGAPVGRFSSSAGDRAYYLEYRSGPLRANQFALGKVVETQPLELADGVIQVLSGPTKVVASDDGNRCVHVRSELDNPRGGFSDAAIAPATNSADWTSPLSLTTLRAVPLPAVTTTGFDLSSELAMDTPYQTDLVGYDPFVNHETVAISAVTAQRIYSHPEGVGAPFFFSAGVEHAVLATSTCEFAEVKIDRAVAIPREISLDGTPLVDNGAAIPMERPGVITLSWELTPGAVDYHDVELFEVVESSGATQLELVQRYRTRNRSLAIDTTQFRFSRYYAFVVTSRYGAPEAASGDYNTRVLPSGAAVHPTAMFQAM